MNIFSEGLGFLASGFGILFVGALAAGIVLLWDWRFALAALFVIQLSFAAIMTRLHGVPAQWSMAQTLVIGLCCIMLALSAMQVQLGRSGRQNGNWFFRSLILVLSALAWQTVGVQLPLPIVSPQVAQLIGWLMLMALLILSLGDTPLFSATALLLWCSITHTLVALFAPIPELIAGVGLIEIVLGLTCSYLILAERLPRTSARPVLTDVVFPDLEIQGRPLQPQQAQSRSRAARNPAFVERAPPFTSPSRPDETDSLNQRDT